MFGMDYLNFNLYQVLLIILVLIIIYMLWSSETIREEILPWIASKPVKAIAVFNAENNISGVVTLTEEPKYGETTIDIDLEGVPEGKHGFHIHQYGDISEGCESACEHYNPHRKHHGDINSGHAGDLGNITADKDGRVKTVLRSQLVKLRGPFNVIGRSLIIHENEDDLGRVRDPESKKTGNSGDRIACAIIGYSK